MLRYFFGRAVLPVCDAVDPLLLVKISTYNLPSGGDAALRSMILLLSPKPWYHLVDLTLSHVVTRA